MVVYVLLTIDSAHEKSCTLVLDSIRTGFPTAEIQIHVNYRGPETAETMAALMEPLQEDDGVIVKFHPIKWHHARWIESVIRTHQIDGGPIEPCVIVDGDMVFWKDVEHYKVHAPYAGDFIPMIWNDFSQCISMPRLHTSFLWIPDTDRLIDKIEATFPNAFDKYGHYCPLDPFGPRVSFINGLPIFWDTCSTLYNMIRGESFPEWLRSQYCHLNSASFYDVMLERVENKKGFELLHSYYVNNTDQLKGVDGISPSYMDLQRGYYQLKHEQALKVLQKFDISPLRSSVF